MKKKITSICLLIKNTFISLTKLQYSYQVTTYTINSIRNLESRYKKIENSIYIKILKTFKIHNNKVVKLIINIIVEVFRVI